MLAKQIVQWLWHIIGSYCTPDSLLVFFSVFLLIFVIRRFYDDNSPLPPGPWGVPIWGYLPFIKNSVHLHFNELAKKYGRIFSIRFGSELIVVLSDPQIIRNTFRYDEFSGRPHTDFMNILDGYGIVNTEGALWRDQRKFLHKILTNLGMTNISTKQRNLNLKIMHEVQIFLDGLRALNGKPTDISSPLAVSISNVICSLTMNIRFNHDDLRFNRFMELIDEGFKLFASLTSANYISLLRYLPWIHSIRNKISQNRKEMAEFFQAIIEEHKATYNKNNIRDVVDAYLFEIQQAENEKRDCQLFRGKNKDRQMQQTLGDLFSAGMETVKTTLEWSVIFMLHNPQAAKAVQDELDHIVGRSRMPTLEDLPFLPITDATIQEILRKSSLVPLGTTHATTQTVKLDGYTLPAGTHVIPLLYTVHMDKNLWRNPEVFRPSRFINQDGKVVKPEYFMPFGVGRRMCLGEVLARMEIFLFFSSLMHKFDLRLPEGASLPSLRGNVGVTISPEHFKVCLVDRDIACDSSEVTGEPANNCPQRNIGSH